MMESIRDRVYFAGEALHETLWGTVGGAWESGERAADAVLRRLAGQADLEPPKPEPPPQQPSPQAHRTAAESKAEAKPKSKPSAKRRRRGRQPE
jgi:ADP-ribose pyrophosphatase YjhB (NUDIX family)